MITEPDMAVLNKVADFAQGTPQIMEDLDLFESKADLRELVLDMQAKGPAWIVVVRPSRARPYFWWHEMLMFFFRDGISALTLKDGRYAVCTWAAH